MNSKILIFLFLKTLTIVGFSIIPYHYCKVSCTNCSDSLLEIDLQCGSDGITYLNYCEANCSKIHCNSSLKILHSGICLNSPKLNSTEAKVPNDNFIKNSTAETSTLLKPECDPFDDCNCNYDLFLICGTDGDTYPNECALNCAKACNSDLKILHYGAC